MTEPVRLLPCPFCGGEANDLHDTYEGWCAITCDPCDAMIRQTSLSATNIEVRASWNRRAQSKKNHKIKMLVAEQAADYGLWFEAKYITESYLQQALRELHALIEEVV